MRMLLVSILFAMAIVSVAACNEAVGAGAESQRSSQRIVPIQPIDVVPDEPGPFAEPLGCSGVFSEGRLRLPTAPIGLPNGLGKAPDMLFAYCEEKSWTITDCDIPFGQLFCHETVLTEVCQGDSDCISGTRCITDETVGTIDPVVSPFGWCSLTCTIDASCLRPDMYCSREGVCRRRIETRE